MIKRDDKRGSNILTENIMFIVLNIVFLGILMLFLFSKMGSAAELEEMHAKQIALLLDSAKEGMTISIDMSEALDKKEESFSKNKVVLINENVVTVKLRENGGYSYSFFSDVKIDDAKWKENKFEMMIGK